MTQNIFQNMTLILKDTKKKKISTKLRVLLSYLTTGRMLISDNLKFCNHCIANTHWADTYKSNLDTNDCIMYV